ncbi:MAG: hypothetical protein EZS28_034976, partial [Streblomastix strix]
VYQAPEVLRYKDGSEKITQTFAVDIWAIGVVVYELLSKRHPFAQEKKGKDYLPITEIARRILEEEPEELPSHYPLNMRNLIKQMLMKDPSRRITAEEILNIPEVAANLARN